MLLVKQPASNQSHFSEWVHLIVRLLNADNDSVHTGM